MELKKASLLLYFLFFLHLQHHSLHAISRSTTRLDSVETNHDNLQVHAESKPEGDAFDGKSKELAFVVKKGSFGGGGGRSFGGGGGRSFGGGRGGRSGEGGRTIGGGGGGIRPIPIYGGGSHHGGRRSSGGRLSASCWLGLSTLVGLVLVL